MFSPIQIKHECTGVEDVNTSNKTATPDNFKYSTFINQDVECRYHQLPQFWNQTQLPNEMSLKNEIHDQQNILQIEETCTLNGYVKDYLQHGILFQLNQYQTNTNNQVQLTEQCQNPTQPNEQLQLSQNIQYSKPANEVQALTIVQSSASVKHNRSGRPPKDSESNAGKKLKCQCEICFKEFGHKSNLFIHMRTHNGERPYKCNQCEKCFTHSGNLAIHMRTHSGERPYGCQICGKMFSHSGNLSTHLRTHSGVKPYKCSVCAKEFRHSGNLSIHERIHSGIKPFQCKVCGKDFYHSGNLTTHMKKHPINSSVNGDQCENKGRQISCTIGNTSINSTNMTSASMPTDVKSIHSAINVIPVKNESIDESKLDNSMVLRPTSS